MQQIGKYELRVIGRNAPICPSCGNWNAMLRGRFGKMPYLQCRDCSYIIPKEKAIYTYYKLDKPGMGNASTYSQVNKGE